MVIASFAQSRELRLFVNTPVNTPYIYIYSLVTRMVSRVKKFVLIFFGIKS